MEETAEKKFNSMKNFINKGQIITQLVNGHYMIYSPRFKMITVMSVSKEKYIDYWTSNSMWNRDDTYIEKIKEVCNDKLENGLIPTEEMIDLVKSSVDRDKDDALRLLRKKKAVVR